jgi:hypothetical protein
VEDHVLLVMEQGSERLGLSFSMSGPDLATVEGLRSDLDQILQSVVLVP